MKMKPRSTTQNPKALLYRRYIGIETSANLRTVYKTNADNIYWLFNSEIKNFVEISVNDVPASSTVITVLSTTVLKYEDIYFKYNNNAWVTGAQLGDGITLLSLTFNNIGKYQMNKYYYVGSFDYMIKGSIEGTTAQYIKGNIIPLNSLNIKSFDDEIVPAVDDLVVIDGKLYSVENPETAIKQQPKPFKIYFATLNNIL